MVYLATHLLSLQPQLLEHSDAVVCLADGERGRLEQFVGEASLGGVWHSALGLFTIHYYR